MSHRSNGRTGHTGPKKLGRVRPKRHRGSGMHIADIGAGAIALPVSPGSSRQVVVKPTKTTRPMRIVRTKGMKTSLLRLRPKGHGQKTREITTEEFMDIIDITNRLIEGEDLDSLFEQPMPVTKGGTAVPSGGPSNSPTGASSSTSSGTGGARPSSPSRTAVRQSQPRPPV